MHALILPLLLLLLSQPLSGYECGRRQMRRSRIIGGNEVPLGKWPWQVRLDMGCGGTIIAPRWIVTAAHCFRYVGEYSRSVAAVAYGTITGSFTDGNNTVRSKKVIVHEKYEELGGERGKLLNDITLVELEKSLSFNRFVQPVCLPSKNTIIPRDAIVIATGFGRWNVVACQTIPRILPTPNCAVAPSVTGDSGGPVVMKTKAGVWFQVGITSWGFSIHEQDASPGVYTNVHEYCDWIEEKTGGEAKCHDAELIDASA